MTEITRSKESEYPSTQTPTAPAANSLKPTKKLTKPTPICSRPKRSPMTHKTPS